MAFPAIDNTLTILDNIQKEVTCQNVFKLIQVLMKALSEAIDEIALSRRLQEFKSYSNKTKLCGSQLMKALPCLFDVVNFGVQPGFKDMIEFLVEKIRWCLMETLRVFSGGGTEGDEEPSGLFVRGMDELMLSLQKGSELSSEFKSAMDEVLCQALMISKLCNENDQKEIAAACKNVLSGWNALMETDFTSGGSLQKDIILCSFETLERRVNVAVLRVFLHLMSEPHLPLKQIIWKCQDWRPHQSRDGLNLEADLDFLDRFLEQVQMMGNFAVACTLNPQTKLKIQSCLASIEFCENFLATAALDFYSNPNDSRRRNFLKFLSEEFSREMMSLHHVMDTVVDTETFLQVVLDDLSPLSNAIKENALDCVFKKREAEMFSARCIKVVRHLRTADESILRSEQMVLLIKDIENGLQEYLYILRTSPLNEHSCQNLISRMDSVIFSISQICSSMGSPDASSLFRSNSRFGKSQLDLDGNSTLNESQLLFKESSLGKDWIRTKFIHDSIVSNSDRSQVLVPLLEKLKETPRLKSALYVVTPRKSKVLFQDEDTLDLTSAWERSGAQACDSFSTFVVHPNAEEDLADTFSTFKSVLSPNEEDFDFSRIDSTFYRADGPNHSSLSVDTAERLQDLAALNSKLNHLGINSN